MARKVGIQLFSVKTKMAQDPVTTIKRVAQIGYKYIEVANHNATADSGCGFGVPAKVLKDTIAEYGSQVVSGHVFPMNPSTIDAVIAYYQEVGAKYLVNPMDVFETKEAVLRKCEEFNLLGKRITEGGLRFCYHNHFHEFQKLGGDKNVMELIMENTDPKYVGIEFDTYWALRGGCDPVEFIKSHADRVIALHQKDLIKDLKEPLNYLDLCGDQYITHEVFRNTIDRSTIVEIGTGCMDIQAIIDAGIAAGNIEYIFLEQDQTEYDEFESIQISMDCFRKFKNIAWN